MMMAMNAPKAAFGIVDVLNDPSEEHGPPDQLMIDATHLKAHRTACSLLKGGMFPALLGALKVG